MNESYKPKDVMSLWWLGQTESTPRLIGQLFLADKNRKVGLEYAFDWVQHGFPLSDDMPLRLGAFLPKEQDMAVGAVDDARPDRWGERVIRNIYKPSRLSLLEFLYFAGDDRFGALGVSPVSGQYIPSGTGTMPSLANLEEMQRAIAAVLAGEQLGETYQRLVRPGPSFGGARPKSLIQIDDAQWVVKFSEGEDFDHELVEHATMRLAEQCGIHVASTRPLPLAKGHAVAVRRFDRCAQSRLHVISANTVLRAVGLPIGGYPELSACLRRIARPDAIRIHQTELFRRMVFNILIDNTDDHEKNHAFIRSADGFYDLSPAYDVVPSVQGLGQQQLRVGKQEAESSLENALSDIRSFGLKKDTAVDIIRKIIDRVNHWKIFFLDQGVTMQDVDMMAQYIDGDALKSQRSQF